MKRIKLFLLFIFIFYHSISLAQDVYRWVDEKGTVHFVDDPNLIPERFLQKSQKLNFPEKSPSPVNEAVEKTPLTTK